MRWPAGTRWDHRATLSDGRAWPAFGRHPQGYLLDFEGSCSFLISGSGDRIDAVPEPATSAETVQRLFLDQVIPLLLNLSGRECLHASAVLTLRGACAFLGDSGAGKSTLAAALALRGHPLLSDDCLALSDSPKGIAVLPGHLGSKLWPDSAAALLEAPDRLPRVAGHASKRALVSIRPPRRPVPLRRIYLLAFLPPGQPAALAPAEVPATTAALVESAFRLDLHDEAMLARQFRFLMRVAGSVPVRRLAYPHDFAALPEVCERVLKDAAE